MVTDRSPFFLYNALPQYKYSTNFTLFQINFSQTPITTPSDEL